MTKVQLTQKRLHDLGRLRQCGIQNIWIAATCLGDIRPAAPSAANHRGKLRDHLACLNASRQILCDAHDQRNTTVRSRPKDDNAGNELGSKLIDPSSHLRFHFRGTPRSGNASAQELDAPHVHSRLSILSRGGRSLFDPYLFEFPAKALELILIRRQLRPKRPREIVLRGT